MPNPVVHWEIAARDAKKAQEFYASLFGWHVDSSNPIGYGFVDTHTETGINGGIPQAEEGDNARVILYVEWTTCRRTSTRRSRSAAEL